jgi:hypothetical protein
VPNLNSFTLPSLTLTLNYGEVCYNPSSLTKLHSSNKLSSKPKHTQAEQEETSKLPATLNHHQTTTHPLTRALKRKKNLSTSSVLLSRHTHATSTGLSVITPELLHCTARIPRRQTLTHVPQGCKSSRQTDRNEAPKAQKPSSQHR